MSRHDSEISQIEPVYGAERVGDIPHSLANTDKAQTLLGYKPKFDINAGLAEAAEWYWKNFQNTR